MTREEELSRDGWEKKFVSCEPRLSEMAELYESLGLEVLVEPLPPKDELNEGSCGAKGCMVCFDADSEKYRIIFTRSRDRLKTAR
ncbi:MAG TPA: hypothetical protein VGJ94_07700 [Syntrophorhabdaceae bacterium]|jgi:hypothetical protein